MCVCSPGFVGDPFVQCIPKLGKKWTKHQIDLHYPLWNVQKIFCPRMSSLSKRNNFKFIVAQSPVEKFTPCVPSPCGSNAVCNEQNGAASCKCIADYIGNPYEGCRPECVINSDCSANQACIRSKCQNPCPGFCGYNAVCQIVNHTPLCTCQSGYTGDPFVQCNVIQAPRKFF